MKSRYAISRSNLDRPLCVTRVRRSGGGSGYLPSGNRHSRGQVLREIQVKTPTRSESSIWGQVSEIKAYRSLTPQKFRVSEGMERSQQEIAIRDFPTRSTPSISEDAWREIPESRSSAYRESTYRGSKKCPSME
jgi:hypothetical protein